MAKKVRKKGQRWESNPQPPHYECGALPIEATLALKQNSIDWRASCKCGDLSTNLRIWDILGENQWTSGPADPPEVEERQDETQ